MERRQVDVAVVGAGISGLTAAARLQAAGAAVAVIEAQPRIGGRLLRVSGPGGVAHDGGGQFVSMAQDRVLALIHELGLRTDPLAIDGDVVCLRAGQRFSLPGGRFDDPHRQAELDEASGRLDNMASALPPKAPWEHPQALAWDRQTFRTWTGSNMRLPLVRELLEAQLASAGPAEEVSLLSVLEFLRGVGGVEGLRTSRHSVVRGGAFQLSERLAASIGESLILDSPVRSIEQSSTGVVVRADTIEAHAEVVIVAIAPPLAELIEFTPALPARRRLIQQRWAQAPSIKITAVYPAPWWRERGFSGRAITDLPVAPVLLDASPSDGSTGVIVSMSSAAQPPPAWVIEDSARRKAQFFEALTCLFGAGPPEPIAYLEANWFGHRWIAGCGQMLPCGVLSGLGDTLRPPVGRVVWAGSEVSERWAAYLDGAVRAAEDAVAQARRVLGSTGAETATPTLTHNRR